MFDDFELSPRRGSPRQLFVFMRQAKVWRFGSGVRDVVISGSTYIAAPISRSEIKQTIEKAQDNITITFPYVRNPAATELPVTQSLGDNWFPYVPQDRITVMCMDYHANDPDLETKIRWQGRVGQPKWNEQAQTLELTCIPNGTAASNIARGPKWQVTCWKTVYSTGPRGCNLDPSKFLLAATITAVSGLALTAGAFATAPYNLAGGTLSWTRSNGLVEERPIMSHTGNTVEVLYFGAELAIGTPVTVLPNCPGTWAACEARGNTQHYGGAIYEPVEDPYNGQSMSWQV